MGGERDRTVPVSSLGHSVILPALIGGRWAADLNVSAPESPYLAFIAERLRRRATSHRPSTDDDDRFRDEDDLNLASDRRLASRPMRETTLIATAQVAALLPGISRSGVTMAAGFFGSHFEDEIISERGQNL